MTKTNPNHILAIPLNSLIILLALTQAGFQLFGCVSMTVNPMGFVTKNAIDHYKWHRLFVACKSVLRTAKFPHH